MLWLVACLVTPQQSCKTLKYETPQGSLTWQVRSSNTTAPDAHTLPEHEIPLQEYKMMSIRDLLLQLRLTVPTNHR